MSYTSQDELTKRYGTPMLLDLTDRASPPAGTIDSDVVTEALVNADAAIDGYLLGRYILPLSTTPPLLKDLAQAIAIYKLHRNSVPDMTASDYASALATLKLIASGTVRLNVAGVEPTASSATGVRTTDRDKPLTSDSLRGFI
jgi:phage gp36-like protein